jgi:hypothetical protein
MEVFTINQRVSRLRQLAETGPFVGPAIDVESIVEADRDRQLGFATDGTTETGMLGSEVYTNFSNSLGFNSASLMERMESFGLLEKASRIEQFPNGLRVIWKESGENHTKLYERKFWEKREKEVRCIINGIAD